MNISAPHSRAILGLRSTFQPVLPETALRTPDMNTVFLLAYVFSYEPEVLEFPELQPQTIPSGKQLSANMHHFFESTL